MPTVYGNTIESTFRSYLTYKVTETADDYKITVNDFGIDIITPSKFAYSGPSDGGSDTMKYTYKLGSNTYTEYDGNYTFFDDRSILARAFYTPDYKKELIVAKTTSTQSVTVSFSFYTKPWVKFYVKEDVGYIVPAEATTTVSVTLTIPALEKPTVVLTALRDSNVETTVTFKATVSSFSSDVISSVNLIVNGTTYSMGSGTVGSSGSLTFNKTLTGLSINRISASLVANGKGGASDTYACNIPGAFYTLDIGNKGKEIAFGQSATTNQSMIPSNGLFSCGMSPIFFSLAGEIKMWAGDAIPYGWLLCDGSEVSKTKYPNLYAAIGDLWGVPSSSSNFKLPNLTGRVPVGYNSADTDTTETFGQVGATGGARGAWYHTHTIGSSGAHNHASQGRMEGSGTGANIFESYNGASKTRSVNVPRTGTNGNHTHSPGSSGSAGNKLAADKANMPPYAVVKYIICAI